MKYASTVGVLLAGCLFAKAQLFSGNPFGGSVSRVSGSSSNQITLNQVSNVVSSFFNAETNIAVSNLTAKHLISTGPTPTFSWGTGSGNTGPVSNSITGTDVCGLVTLRTGTGPAINGAEIFTITFSRPYNNKPKVIVTPAEPTTGTPKIYSDFYVRSYTTGFDLLCGTTSLQAGTNYAWHYVVIE